MSIALVRYEDQRFFIIVLWTLKDITLTPKGRRSFFGPFLKFGQAIVDAIFIQTKNLKFLVNMWFSPSFKVH
jgi:hypothetical protein